MCWCVSRSCLRSPPKFSGARKSLWHQTIELRLVGAIKNLFHTLLTKPFQCILGREILRYAADIYPEAVAHDESARLPDRLQKNPAGSLLKLHVRAGDQM